MHLCCLFDHSVIWGLFIIIVLFILNKYFGFEFMTLKNENKNDGNQTNYCESKDCVRCNTYGDTVAKALTKVERIEDRDVMERIKNGINHKPFEGDEKQQPNVFCYYGLESTPVWKTEILGDCDILTNSSEIIKAEFYSLIRQGTQEGWKRNRTPQGSWDVFHLINQGLEVPENCNRCPKTMAVIWSLQSAMVENVFGNVMFSVLKSGTVITAHYGPTNIRLRCHLGLQVPPKCMLRVDDQPLEWEEGSCLVFDDSFSHSVTHLAEEGFLDRRPDEGQEDGSSHDERERFCPATDRVVLIVDLWHPALTEEEKEAINLVFSPE